MLINLIKLSIHVASVAMLMQECLAAALSGCGTLCGQLSDGAIKVC
jgi:hypothetical protein